MALRIEQAGTIRLLSSAYDMQIAAVNDMLYYDAAQSKDFGIQYIHRIDRAAVPTWMFTAVGSEGDASASAMARDMLVDFHDAPADIQIAWGRTLGLELSVHYTDYLPETHDTRAVQMTVRIQRSTDKPPIDCIESQSQYFTPAACSTLQFNHYKVNNDPGWWDMTTPHGCRKLYDYLHADFQYLEEASVLNELMFEYGPHFDYLRFREWLQSEPMTMADLILPDIGTVYDLDYFSTKTGLIPLMQTFIEDELKHIQEMEE